MSDRLTTPEAAALLGLAPGTMRQLAKAGVLHPSKPSPRVLIFERAELERYARERRPRGRPGKGAEQ